jgi:CBS domain-containing protein
MQTTLGHTRDLIESFLGTVESIMQRRVVHLRPDQSLQDAIRDLERAGVSGGPVIDGQQVIGMVGLADLFAAAGIDPKSVATSGPWHRYEHLVGTKVTHRTVADAMSPRVVSIHPEASIADAAQAMRANHVNRLPVLKRDGALVGIVARDDIIATVAEASRVIHESRLHLAPSIPPD